MMRDPKTEPIPAPEPATPTVAAPLEGGNSQHSQPCYLTLEPSEMISPAPMNLAAESMSDLGAEVESHWAWAVAGLMLLRAARESRGERRARADILSW